MPAGRRYICDADVKKKILQKVGIMAEEVPTREYMPDPVTYLMCETLNTSDSRFCER